MLENSTLNRMLEGYNKHVSSAAGDLTNIAARFIEEQTNKTVGADAARSYLPIAGAAAVAAGGLIARKPLNRMTEYVGKGARQLITGFGYLEEIPLIGGAFRWLGEKTEKIGGYAGYGVSAAASLLTYSVLQAKPEKPRSLCEDLPKDCCGHEAYVEKIKEARRKLDRKSDEAFDELEALAKQYNVQNPVGTIRFYNKCKGGIDISARTPDGGKPGTLYCSLWPDKNARVTFFETRKEGARIRIEMPKAYAMLEAWSELKQLEEKKPAGLDLPNITYPQFFDNLIKKGEARFNHRMSDKARKEWTKTLQCCVQPPMEYFDSFLSNRPVAITTSGYEDKEMTKWVEKSNVTSSPHDTVSMYFELKEGALFNTMIPGVCNPLVGLWAVNSKLLNQKAPPQPAVHAPKTPTVAPPPSLRK